MALASSTAVIGAGVNGVISTTGNYSQFVDNSYWDNDYLEVYGVGDTVLGNSGSDSIGVMLYPALGMNGNYAYIDGGSGSDVLVAGAIQGNQYATLIGGAGVDSYGFGCNSDSTINVVLTGDNFYNDYVAVFYEGYRDGAFTCYSTNSGYIVRDDAGRLNVTVTGVDAGTTLNNGWLWIYPHGVRANSAVSMATEVLYGGEWKRFGEVVRYGGYLSGLAINGNTLSVNDYHSGGVVTNGVYGLEGIVVIDNTQSTQARFLGGNAQTNYIYAGNGGDTLWGAANNDVLIGGVGSDNFLYGVNEGVDFVTNSDWLDTVNLYNMTLGNISGVQAEAGRLTLAQDANNAVVIQYNGVYSPLIKFSDGSQYRYNGANNSWQNV